MHDPSSNVWVQVHNIYVVYVSAVLVDMNSQHVSMRDNT